jgi:hypothetical protein
MEPRKETYRLGVDSGRMILGDPCYFARSPDFTDFDRYHELCSQNDWGVFSHTFCGLSGDALSFPTGFGDGVYEVTVEYGTGSEASRVRRVSIEFFKEGERFDLEEVG